MLYFQMFSPFLCSFSLGGVQILFLFFFFKKPKSEDRDLDVFCVVTPIPLVVRSVRSVP